MMFRAAMRLVALVFVILAAGTAIASFAEDPEGRPGHVPGCRWRSCNGCTPAMWAPTPGERR